MNEVTVSNKRKLNNKGFTLVEILVAATILALVLAPMASMFVTTAKVNAMAKEKQQATVVAQNVFEGIKNFGVSGLSKDCTEFSPETFRIVAGEIGNARIIRMIIGDEAGYEYEFSDVSINGKAKFNINILVTKDITKTDIADSDLKAESEANLSILKLRKKSYYDVELKVYNSNDTSKVIAEFSGSVFDYQE